MLIRIVTMTFDPAKIDKFLQVFSSTHDRIEAFEGCDSVTLLRDLNEPGVLSTFSKWKDEAALEAYRKSEFFQKTWSTVKPMFVAPATARSYSEVRTSH